MSTKPIPAAKPAQPISENTTTSGKNNNLQLFKSTLKELLNISISELKEAKGIKAIEYDSQINSLKEKILENKKETIKIVEKDTQTILDELDAFKKKIHAEISSTIEKSEAAKLKSLEQINAAENSKKVNILGRLCFFHDTIRFFSLSQRC
jgi:hypothetical protein